jgi:hypothetical protein
MNIEINPDYEKSTTLRALSAFLTLLADEQEGETKDAAILSAIVQKGLNHEEPELVVKMNGQEVAATVEGTTLTLAPAEAEPAPLQAQEEAAPPKRTRRTKAEMAADAGNAAPAAAEKAAPATDSATVEASIDDVRAALQRYTAVHGMPDGIALLKNYGAGRISELGVEQYPLFIAECDAVEA